MPTTQTNGSTQYTICKTAMLKAQNMWQYTWCTTYEVTVLKAQSGREAIPWYKAVMPTTHNSTLHAICEA